MEEKPPTASEFNRFKRDHLPNLYKYVVPIAHEDIETEEESLGSGASVNINGRHFIATARHCIEQDTRVLLNDYYFTGGRFVSPEAPRILSTQWHDTLDLGFLELDQAIGQELKADQLSFDPILSGVMHVLGFPVCNILRDEAQNPTTIQKCAFGTEIIEQADTYLKFKYPVLGVEPDEAGKNWVSALFPETPKGFSGGPCVGVMRRDRPTGSHRIQVIRNTVQLAQGREMGKSHSHQTLVRVCD